MKPYNELAVTLRANYLQLNTLYSNGSVAIFIYFLAFFLSDKTYYKISGNKPY